MLNVDTYLILQFLELKGYREQAEFVRAHREDVTDQFLRSAAASLDYVETGESLDERREELLRVLHTKEKFEKKRR